MLCLRGSVKRYLSRSFTTRRIHTLPRRGDKVFVGMSGGVDSSVAATLLVEQDFDLSAIFMRNWDSRDEKGTDDGCEWKRDWEDVQRVCSQLGIPCKMIDLSKEYWTRVWEPTLRQYETGITPNPDVWCNREIKFGALLDRLPLESQTSDAWLATGHYARKSWSSSSVPRPKLLAPRDRIKDQTYYLSSISEAGLARALFPLSELTKPEVRALARKHRLPTAERPESMGICFVGEKKRTDFKDFISSYIPSQSGEIRDLTTGKTIGKHDGVWNYTIGEKARISGMPFKMYVAAKDIERNVVFVVPGGDHPALYCRGLSTTNWTWIWRDSPPAGIDTAGGFRAMVRFRRQMEEVPCRVTASPEVEITFDEPQKAIATGQVAALWDGEWCLGCGIISRVEYLSDMMPFGKD